MNAKEIEQVLTALKLALAMAKHEIVNGTQAALQFPPIDERDVAQQCESAIHIISKCAE